MGCFYRRIASMRPPPSNSNSGPCRVAGRRPERRRRILARGSLSEHEEIVVPSNYLQSFAPARQIQDGRSRFACLPACPPDEHRLFGELMESLEGLMRLASDGDA